MNVKNLEAKFPLVDLLEARKRAEGIGYVERARLTQRDTFFRVAHGKLKLREEDDRAMLIHYAREEQSAALQLSTYHIVPIVDPEPTRRMLEASLGTIAVVRKERILLTRDNVRFHLDRVHGLGDFGEIEAVIAENADPEDSRAAVDQLLSTLSIGRSDLIEVSYFELIAGGPARSGERQPQ